MIPFYYIYADFVDKAHKKDEYIQDFKTVIELAEEGYELLGEDNLHEAYYEAGDVLFFTVSLSNQLNIDLSIPFTKPRLYANASLYDMEHGLSAIMRLVKLLLRDNKPIDNIDLAFKLSRLLSAITQFTDKSPTQLAYLNMIKLNERYAKYEWVKADMEDVYKYEKQLCYREDLNALVQEASRYAQCTFEQGISLQRFAEVHSWGQFRS